MRDLFKAKKSLLILLLLLLPCIIIFHSFAVFPGNFCLHIFLVVSTVRVYIYIIWTFHLLSSISLLILSNKFGNSSNRSRWIWGCQVSKFRFKNNGVLYYDKKTRTQFPAEKLMLATW